MKQICFLGLAFGGFVLATPAYAGDEPPKDARAALEKFAAANSYTFTVEENKTKVGEARYQKGQPLHCHADQIEIFKKADVVVYKDGDRWLRSKRGTVSDPLRILGAVSKVNALRLPHEELAKLLKDVKIWQVDPNDKNKITAQLPMELTGLLARTEHKSVAQSGTATIYTDAEGVVRRYELSIRLQGAIGNAEIDGSWNRVVSLKGVGSTKVEIPEAAAKALE